jgi:hypothetical protein
MLGNRPGFLLLAITILITIGAGIAAYKRGGQWEAVICPFKTTRPGTPDPDTRPATCPSRCGDPPYSVGPSSVDGNDGLIHSYCCPPGYTVMLVDVPVPYCKKA